MAEAFQLQLLDSFLTLNQTLTKHQRSQKKTDAYQDTPLIELTVRVDYLQRATGGGVIAIPQEQLTMDRESLEMQVEMCMLSLYGKVGGAQLQFALRDYSRKASTFTLITDLESYERVWRALVLGQATMDGLTALRFTLTGPPKCLK